MKGISLATEDELSETVGLRLITDITGRHCTPLLLRKNGFGYLKSKMDNWIEMARWQHVIIITDLDQAPCAASLIEKWTPKNRFLPSNLLIRVAVREVESWLLADHLAITKLVGNKGILPKEPDKLSDPKRHLLKLASLAPRPIRDDMVGDKHAEASQGLGYNTVLTHWVRTQWCPDRAALLSPSLKRARLAIRRILSE